MIANNAEDDVGNHIDNHSDDNIDNQEVSTCMHMFNNVLLSR